MRIDLGAKVRTNDGHKAGEVKQAIWDPRGNEITQFVVTTGGLLGHDVIVSPELLESAARDGRVNTTPPADWRAPSASGFPSGGYLWPVTEAETVPVDESPISAGQSRGPKVTKST